MNLIDYLYQNSQNSKIRDKTALFYEDSFGNQQRFSYKQIDQLAGQFGHFLKSQGIKNNEHIYFYLPRIPLLYAGIIAALKIGAWPTILFPAYGGQAVNERYVNGDGKIMITDEELSKRLSDYPNIKKIILNNQTIKLINQQPNFLKPIDKLPQEPALMIFTSATGNTPVSGILLPHQAINQQIESAKIVLNLKSADCYWCTADPAWVTGVIYGLLVPWSLGTSQLVYNGRFEAEKWYQLIEKYQISNLYSSPTALRMLEASGDLYQKYNLKSVRSMASVGEPLTPGSFNWTKKVFGQEIRDTWWQTETGSILIANYPPNKIKPGSMGKPLPGIEAAILDDEFQPVKTNQTGQLAIKKSWPSMMIDIWQKPKLYQSYFKDYWFLTGDLAYQDQDGYFWFVGRKNEIIKTSGERVGSFEVESCLSQHPAVLESAVIGVPDQLRGQIIKAFVVLKKRYQPSDKLIGEIQQFVKTNLAGHAYPRQIKFVTSLPKNPAGKILRKNLRGLK